MLKTWMPPLKLASTMVNVVYVALSRRDERSQKHSLQAFGHGSYHWAILVGPEGDTGNVCQSYDATDAAPFDPVTFRIVNPEMKWRFQHKLEVDPELSARILGRIAIGQLPDDMSDDSTKAFFEALPLPVKNQNPQQNCVTWVMSAIRALQAKGWVPGFDLDEFKTCAFSYGDRRYADSEDTAVAQYRGN